MVIVKSVRNLKNVTDIPFQKGNQCAEEVIGKISKSNIR